MVDGYTYAKMRREDADREAEELAARSPEQVAADEAIVARCRAEDAARDAELRRRIKANGGNYSWGMMNDWRFEG